MTVRRAATARFCSRHIEYRQQHVPTHRFGISRWRLMTAELRWTPTLTLGQSSLRCRSTTKGDLMFDPTLVGFGSHLTMSQSMEGARHDALGNDRVGGLQAVLPRQLTTRVGRSTQELRPDDCRQRLPFGSGSVRKRLPSATGALLLSARPHPAKVTLMNVERVAKNHLKPQNEPSAPSRQVDKPDHAICLQRPRWRPGWLPRRREHGRWGGIRNLSGQY